MAINDSRINELNDEIKIALRLSSDHAKLIRSSLDPIEKDIFKLSTNLSDSFDNVLESSPTQTLVNDTTPLLLDMVELTNNITTAIQRCRIKISLPADILQHMRRETDFFLGIIDAVTKNEFTKNREVLGIHTRHRMAAQEAGNIPVITLPRSYISTLPIDQAQEVILAWSEFWTRDSIDHPDLLTILTRPSYDALISRFAEFKDIWRTQFRSLETQSELSVPLRFILNFTDEWNNYLVGILDDLKMCRMQQNFPQSLVEHMIIENNLLSDAIYRYKGRF